MHTKLRQILTIKFDANQILELENTDKFSIIQQIHVNLN